MIEILFSISFFLFNGNIIDTKLTHHQYEKENYKEIFYLKNNDSVNTYCVRHSEVESIKKVKWNRASGLQETNYKVSKPTENILPKKPHSIGK